MLSFTQSVNLFQTLTNNTSAANATLGATLINNADAEVLAIENWDFLEITKTTSTVASQQYYGLPYDYDVVKSVTVTIGTTQYNARPIASRDEWNTLNETTSTYSDIPEWFYVTEGQLGLWPTPSSSITNGLKITYEVKRKDFSIADYTTGTIVTATNGQTSIVGSGTSWTSKMNGFWLRITDSAAANTGDGYWYQIDTVTSATTLTLKSAYGGPSISAGSASYVIGQTSLIPGDFQITPVYKAVAVYYTSIQPDVNRASQYKALYNEHLAKMRIDNDKKISSPVIDYGQRGGQIANPNLFIVL